MDKHKNIENIYPLSPMQQGILFHSLLAPDNGAYVPQVCITINGLTNVIALQTAWTEVLKRHSVLRTAFRWEKRERPFQVVYRALKLPWEQLNWREFSQLEQQRKLEDFLESDRQGGFDLKIPPLFRITLIQLAETRYQLIWTQHHLIIDGWSVGIIIKQVFEIYRLLNEGADLTAYHCRPYADYIAWLEQQDLSAAKKFWQNQLQGFTTPNILQVKQSSPNLLTPKWSELEISLPARITTALKDIAKKNKFTINTLIQGAFAILLSRYCNQDDIVFGATSSGRPATFSGSESMVGLFINTLPVRVQVDQQASLIPWLQKLQTQQAEVLQYEYTPLFEIQNWSDIPRGGTLFNHILVFENYPVDVSWLQSQVGLNIEKVRSLEWTSFPLTVLVSAAKELNFKAKYNLQQFDDYTIYSLLVNFYTLLENISTNSQQCLGEISLLRNRQQQILAGWNATITEYPQQCIHELFEMQVERTPNATAVVFEDYQLTYTQLNSQANQLAHYLRSIGVQEEVLVGICLQRSLEMVIGILAILKAGGAYVPLDPDYPQERLDFIQWETQVITVLTQDKIQGILANVEQFSQSNLINKTFPENSIYVIYTSGSTGKPKGVINTHRGLVNRLSWMQATYQLTASDRVLQKTPFSFDVSVWEFFWTLLSGAALIIAEPGGHKDSGYLVSLIQSQKVTTIHFVPSMLEAFLEESQIKCCTSLKRVICSGEELKIELEKRFFACLDSQLYNLYGPTEAAIDVTYFECGKQIITDEKENINSVLTVLTVPIGSPIHNTQIYILDSHLRQVPMGVAGELYIGSDGLARGYLKRPDLTAEKFIPNPFNKLKVKSQKLKEGNNKAFNSSPASPAPSASSASPASPASPAASTLYKTGDLARFLPDGNIEFLGRIDYQVKIRGFRIELGEIEAVISQHPEVKMVVVIAKQNKSNNLRLIAYIVPIKQDIEQTELQESLPTFLEAKLPEYMVPSTFIITESIPLTSSGKIDRVSLIAMDDIGIKLDKYVQPRNRVEETIANIWKEVLKLDSIGVYDKFFALGGNSLLATRINSRLRQTFELDLPLRSIFEKPTIAAMAEYIQALQITIQQPQEPIIPSKGRKEIEL